MDLPATFLIGASLSMDCLAVALAAGTAYHSRRHMTALIVAIFFGGFQAGMTMLGWGGGAFAASLIGGIDHWIAFLILAAIGVKMIFEGINARDEEKEISLSIIPLLFLSLATSMDALAVGLGLGILGSGIIIPALIIGCTSAAISAAGVMIGSRLASSFGEKIEIVGGVILIAIGIRILAEHLLII